MWHGQTSACPSSPCKEYMASQLWSPMLKTSAGSCEKKPTELVEETRGAGVTTHTEYFTFEHLHL